MSRSMKVSQDNEFPAVAASPEKGDELPAVKLPAVRTCPDEGSKMKGECL